MDGPLRIARHITLEVEEPLDKAEIRSWLDSVVEHAPSGTVATVQQVNEKGSPVAVALVHREVRKCHRYIVPLTRDLSDDEIKGIVEAFASKHKDLDFDVCTQETHLSALHQGKMSVEQERHHELGMTMAKQRHTDWMRDRTESGWRYGVKMSQKDKTHPLLRPWEDLPERFRKPDLDGPQSVVDALSDQGYTVVAKDELQRLLDRLK